MRLSLLSIQTRTNSSMTLNVVSFTPPRKFTLRSSMELMDRFPYFQPLWDLLAKMSKCLYLTNFRVPVDNSSERGHVPRSMFKRLPYSSITATRPNRGMSSWLGVLCAFDTPEQGHIQR